MNIKQASSARALVELANKKGYSLFASTYCNLLFVSNEFKEKVIGDDDNSLNVIRDDSECKNYVFIGQDNTIFTSKKIILPSHWLEFETNHLQVLPKYLIKYVGDYNFAQKILLRLYKIYLKIIYFKKSNSLLKKIKTKLSKRRWRI